uniref:NADH-ubiquinone oxidoreductase chain 6 n=1 Tax=Tenebrionoidea sp. 10 KM-2017 TaxID=2219465 RepID=A0A346RIH1_9CUCU|nr:NADH dehydrogenase subunit 6 [Tenebrionoidea sp. 10 KM-2017]
MLMNMMILNFTLTIIFLFLKHPMSMGSVLLMQTILVSLIMGNLSFNYYYSYILFIIMVGGLMILFLYMTSIASNEPFSKNFLLLIPFSLLLFQFMTNKNLFNFFINNEEMLKMENFKEFNYILSKFINLPSSLIMLFLFIYLFLTLIAIVKITSLKNGPLRQLN